jgi:predicted transcriptional regulator
MSPTAVPVFRNGQVMRTIPQTVQKRVGNRIPQLILPRKPLNDVVDYRGIVLLPRPSILDLRMLTAEQIVSDHYVAVRPETSIGKAIELMIEERTCILLVLSHAGQLIGTLEDSVALRAAIDTHLRQDPVSLHMSRRFASVSGKAPVDVALDQFVLHDLQFLPVVDAMGGLAGVIQRADILRAAFQEQPLAAGPWSG